MSEGERWAASNNTAVLLLSSKGLHLSKPRLKRGNMKDGGTPSQNNWSDLMIIFWEVRDIWHVFHTECMFTCTFWTRFMTLHIVYSKQTRSGEKWLSELFIKESRLMTIYDVEVCIRHCTWACHIFRHLLTFFDQFCAYVHVFPKMWFMCVSRGLSAPVSRHSRYIHLRDMEMNIFIPRHNDFSLITWHLP